MTQTIIPAGYRLSVTSWENDADNYQTTVHEGLEEERVEYILELCKLFKSKKRKGCFGNMYDPSEIEREEVAEAIRAVMEKHRAVLTLEEIEVLDTPIIPEEEYADEGFSDVVCAFLECSPDYAYRVYERAKVEHIPHEIRMEDVTKQFKV
jgi:hypothetical protein